MKLPLSVFIITLNEADRIGRAIESVRDFADEIIVVDSGSTDDTVKIAELLGARVVYNSWNGYGLQKRFGEDHCRNRWLLNIDADEEITPLLAQEIHALFANGEPPLSGYIIQMRDLLPGETELAPMAHTNYVVRLYNREKARFSDSPVHDSVIVREGETGKLRHPALHRSFRSIAHMVEKMNSYTSMQAQELQKRGFPQARWRIYSEFPLMFFKAYVLRGYLLRGRRGFIYAAHYAFGRFIRLAKFLENAGS